MQYYNLPHSRKWLYENDDGVLYEIPVYQNEYPDGRSHPATGVKNKLTGVKARRRKESAEEASLADVPDVVLEATEDL